MRNNDSLYHSRERRGFSLMEPAVVALIAVLAAIGIPTLLARSERQKASEAFKYLAAVQTAQEQFHADHQRYASDLSDLDLDRLSPAYFDVGAICATEGVSNENPSSRKSWSLSLTRSGGGVYKVYGNYSVSFTQQGFDAVNSDIDSAIYPRIED